jgi:hypothetical protein
MAVDCTCDNKPPRHESLVTKGIRYAIYLDVWEDDSVIDPACPYHGENGSMVVTIKVRNGT